MDEQADLIIERRSVDPGHQLSLLKDIYVERGDKEDWEALHELHYKADGRPIGPVIYRARLAGNLIGVCMLSVPKMLLSGRNEVFKHLRPNVGGLDTKAMNTYRAKWMNANMQTNSRLVVDTMYRGAGIAYRFQNLACRMSGRRFIEFQSSMSKFNPFAAKAGFRFIKPKRATNYERGLAFFRRHFTAIPSDFVGVLAELETMPPASRDKAIAEMRDFYYDYSSMEKSGDNRLNGTKRVDQMPVPALLKNLQQLVLASPLYGVFINPDYQTAMPKRLPLLAFDWQEPGAPLRLDLLPKDWQ